MPILVGLPITTQGNVELWRKLRLFLKTFGFKNLIEFMDDECRMNYGVIGNRLDCKMLAAAVFDARKTDPVGVATYFQNVIVKYYRNGRKPSRYQKII